MGENALVNDELDNSVEDTNLPKIYTSEPISDDVKNKLIELSHDMKNEYVKYKKAESEFNKKKNVYKQFLISNKISRFRDNEVKIHLCDIEKQKLNEEKTLQYLHDKGLEKYIHTKEYFILEELYMAATKNEVNPIDLGEFREVSVEKRLTIK